MLGEKMSLEMKALLTMKVSKNENVSTPHGKTRKPLITKMCHLNSPRVCDKGTIKAAMRLTEKQMRWTTLY